MDYARALVEHPRWRWEPGMRASYGIATEIVDYGDGAPDVRCDSGAGGVQSTGFSVWRMGEGGRREQFTVLHDPLGEEPFVARRVDVVVPGEEVQWGKWEPSKLPESFDGFATSKRSGAATEKQVKVWQQHARRLGLDVDPGGDAVLDQPCERLFGIAPGAW